MNLEENQNKIYVKAMTFTTDPWNLGLKIMQ